MIYNGYFRDIKKDSLYTVKITTPKGDTTKEITLSNSPFTTEMDSSKDIIYQPVKYQTATIEAISGDYMFDIFSGKAQEVKTELYKGDDVVWTGYVRPNLYDMGFEKSREVIQIECQDALSTLQYFPYKQTDKQIRTLLYIVNKVLERCNAYKTFYVSDNTQLTSTSDSCIMNDLYLSERNFFDDKDKDDTDDDVAWKCDEVLEEICRYLGLTAIADKDSVYFIDYDAIKKGINTYWKYNVGDITTGTKVTVAASKRITKEDYSANGAKISLGNVYNKVTIDADLNDFDSVIPDLFNTAYNITADSDDTSKDAGVRYSEIIKSTLGDKSNNNMIVLVSNPVIEDDSDASSTFGGTFYSNIFNVVAVKYFNNPNYKFFKYKGTTDVTDSIKQINYTDTTSMNGATICKFYVKKLNIPNVNNFWEYINLLKGGKIDIDKWMAYNNVTNISLSDYILMTSSDNVSNNDITKYPYFKTTVTDTTSLFGGKNAYLIISGQYYYHNNSSVPYPIPDGEFDITGGRYSIDEGQTYLLCKLQWGSLYWNGSDWVDTDTTFKLPYTKADAGKFDRRADQTMFKNTDFRNTVTWRIGTNEKGYLIKTPSNKVISGLPILTVYRPIFPNYHSNKSGKDKGQFYKHRVVLLKDFSIKGIIADPTYSNNSETDTSYSLNINTDYVKELSSIKFEINTWDNKKPNYSCVAYKDSDGDFNYLDATYNKALASEVKGITFTDSNNQESTSDGTLRQEWWLVYRIYKQYNEKYVNLDMSLRNNNEIYGLYAVHDLGDRQFIVDHINKDYRNYSQDITLVEKK